MAIGFDRVVSVTLKTPHFLPFVLTPDRSDAALESKQQSPWLISQHDATITGISAVTVSCVLVLRCIFFSFFFFSFFFFFFLHAAVLGGNTIVNESVCKSCKRRSTPSRDCCYSRAYSMMVDDIKFVEVYAVFNVPSRGEKPVSFVFAKGTADKEVRIFICYSWCHMLISFSLSFMQSCIQFLLLRIRPAHVSPCSLYEYKSTQYLDLYENSYVSPRLHSHCSLLITEECSPPFPCLDLADLQTLIIRSTVIRDGAISEQIILKWHSAKTLSMRFVIFRPILT